MIPSWTTLDEKDRSVFSAVVGFLETRLAERDTIKWALGLKADRQIERIAVVHLLDSTEGRVLKEPWSTAWHLVRESWSQPLVDEDTRDRVYTIGDRLRKGDRSRGIVSDIIELVLPSLVLKPIHVDSIPFVTKRRRPTTLHHLVSASLTSGYLVDLARLGLGELTEAPFLNLLANELEAAVTYGLDLARQTGRTEDPAFWPTRGLRRVRYMQLAPKADQANEPEVFHRGLGPAVKLLHAVVARIAKLGPTSALPFVRHWRVSPSPIHIRLWATIALETALVSPDEVGEFLIGVGTRQFWDLYSFPEIAELRTRRFAELDRRTQVRIVSLLRKLPPNSWWRSTGTYDGNRQYWAFRELKRIELAGAELTPRGRSWLATGVAQFPQLSVMKIDDGFLKASEMHWIHHSPDGQYDALKGFARLRALEVALSPGSKDLRSFMKAQDWLQQPNKATCLLEDLESVEDGGDKSVFVWNHFGWVHSSKEPATEVKAQRDLPHEGERVLRLLNVLSAKTLSAAIEGVSNWLHEWREEVIASPLGLSVWMRVWPIAVEATNAREQMQGDSDLSVSDTFDDQESMHIDKSHTSAGKLVSVLLACLAPGEHSDAFVNGSVARRMKDAVLSATGRSGLIARFRLIERLPLFLLADYDWTIEHLIPTLSKADESLVLWRAVARRTRTTDVLKIIGNEMAERATDLRLDRQTRKSLAASLVRESLHAFRENRTPAVPTSHIQQMLRSLDDEVRGDVARGIREFVEGVEDANNEASAAERFRSAVAPFLQKVWPQERSLSTPSVSHFFAQLPATSGEAFAEAVDVIERFLMPFECWSILHFLLDSRGQLPNAPKLSDIDDAGKAKALLRLLDLTVGTSEGAAIPYDLSDALERVRTVAPGLVNSPAYRRLSTAARR